MWGQSLLPEKLKLHAPGELRKIPAPPPSRGIQRLPSCWMAATEALNILAQPGGEAGELKSFKDHDE